MQVIYCRRHTLGSFALRTVLRSSWSHCAILTPHNSVIESSQHGGVIETPYEEFKFAHSKMAIKDIPLPDDDAAIFWAYDQLGKPYDWWGCLGIAFNDRKWNDQDAWFCSELIEGACVAGGRARFTQDAWRVTPQLSWMVC